MAVVTLPYVPTDGTTLNPDQLNRNWHSAVAGESLYGTLNGNIEGANMDAAFRIRPEHVRPGETFRAREEHGMETLDYYDDLWPSPDSSGQKQWVPIAHVGSRLYVPWDCTCVLYSVSIFYTVFRVRERAIDDGTDVRTGPDIQLALYIDDVRLSYTRRECPITYWPSDTASADAVYLTERESVQTQHLDLQHLSIAGSVDDAQTKAGYHDVSLRLYMPANIGQENLRPPFVDSGLSRIVWDMSHRFRCGIRSARVTAFP